MSCSSFHGLLHEKSVKPWYQYNIVFITYDENWDVTNPLKQCVTRQVTIDWSRSDNAVSGPGPKLFASNCSDCTQTCTTHPLATILSSNDDIVVTINWSSLRTCVKFVSLIQNRKGSRIISFVFWRNGQWGTYQKRKLTTEVSIWWDTNLWCFWCW